MRQNNGAGHIIMMAFFASILSMGWLSGGLTEEIRKGDNGNIKIVDHELFSRQNISGEAGIFEFVNNRTEEEPGLTNFDKGRLLQNEAFAFQYISIGYQTGEADKAGEVDYLGKLPNALRNSEFEIKQNGRTVVTMPTAALSNPYTGQNVNDQYTMLQSIAVLDDVNQFTWSFEFPKGTQIPAAAAGADGNHYLEVRLKGHKTMKKAA